MQFIKRFRVGQRAIKTAISVGLALALAMVLGSSLPIFAAIGAISVMSRTWVDSLKESLNQIAGTFLGYLIACVFVTVLPNPTFFVWMALGDWSSKDYGGSADCPVEVNTTKEDTFFDPKGPNVIAYGKFVTDHDMGWTKIEIPLEYVSTSRRPTHIIVSCAASMLGDYFTGSPDSIMWIDDIRLEY